MFDNIFSDLPTLETDRLILRKILYSDMSDIYSYATNPNVAKHVLWEPHKNKIDTIKFIDLIQDAYDQNNAAPWGIEFKATKKIIGTAGFVSFDEDNIEAEIGFALSQEYWNKRIITETVSEILKFGFEKIFLKKISGRCKPENIVSCRIFEKFNFSFEGLSKKNIMIKGRLEDMNIYSLTSENYWKNKNPVIN